MKIKKLELVGFKSFVDRTVLHFDHDVLAIVGPNGCGKSNIVDAIRWCMGEQSARHLRGRSMDDVIFNGSESRAPNDFAEVTLTFENDVPTELPLEYREYSEVAVTRRLHRSGDSDYLINKTSVRLRDVTDLFLGTGAGTKAYSIVEQGKVGLIVSAKPEDRRLLIEEAAGITKFKSRKKQAEKKMELTQQNLLRVGDIVAEIERSLASLKRQAAKAERYVSYREELEDLQLHEASHRFLELIGWIKLETGEVAAHTEEADSARTELATRDADLEIVRVELGQAQERLDAATNTSFAADNAVRMIEAAIERAKDKLAALGSRERQAEAEQRDMADQFERLVAEREVVGRDIVASAEAESTHATTVAEREATLAAEVAAHRVVEGRVAEHRQAIATARSEVAAAEAKLAGLERRHGEMSARRDRLRAEREGIEASRADLETRSADLSRAAADCRSRREAASAQKEQHESRLGELKRIVLDQERALETLKNDLSRKRSRHGALVEMHARFEGVGVGPKTVMTKRDPRIAGLVADRVEAPDRFTHALAGLLGAKLQHLLVRGQDLPLDLLEGLARSRRGRATLLPAHVAFVAAVGAAPLPTDEAVVGRLVDVLRYVPEDESFVRALVGDSIVVTDVASALRLRRQGTASVLVALDGTVLHPDGSIEGGQGDELAAGMLESNRETRELAEEIERLDGLVSAATEQLKVVRDELGGTGAALDRARQEIHSRELALVTAEKDLQKAQGQLESAAQRLATLAGEDGELTLALEGAAFERDEAARTAIEGTSRIETRQEALRVEESSLAEAAERTERARHILTAAKVEAAGVRERLAAARGVEARLSRSSEELGQRVARLRTELDANARAFGETAAQHMAHAAEREAALDAARASSRDLEQVRTTFEELRGGVLEREAIIRKQRETLDVVRERLRAHEMNLREKELAMEHLVAGVADRFRGLRLATVVGDHHLRPPPDEVTRSRIEELVHLIERMGSVNLDAMREHAEAERRFTFYSTQKIDLEKALSDLQRAIAQMNKESRRLFEETFEAVSARFREIFPKMFRGGRAELRMTNPDDLLETGIDIIAQPPGKKLSSIELMSGGEKALTAVSLVFAIFQIRPSPFCILDEVDAPLDEANVARYNEMIRSMTDSSQFILITHIKRTMQMVDVLYGVTMPEAGVSKIVSVKINDAAREAHPRVGPEIHEAVA